jgi:hypothetical protein
MRRGSRNLSKPGQEPGTVSPSLHSHIDGFLLTSGIEATTACDTALADWCTVYSGCVPLDLFPAQGLVYNRCSINTALHFSTCPSLPPSLLIPP